MAKLHESITVERIMQAIEEDDNMGFCLLCGEKAYGVEPDARRYKCESCDARAVFGAEEIRALPYATDGNMLLCYHHYREEMMERLQQLFDGIDGLQFPRCEDLTIYQEV